MTNDCPICGVHGVPCGCGDDGGDDDGGDDAR